MSRYRKLQDAINRAKEDFDTLHMSTVHPWHKLTKQRAWHELQIQIAPLAAELRALEVEPKANLYLVEHKPELIWIRDRGISMQVAASALGLTMWQVRDILDEK